MGNTAKFHPLTGARIMPIGTRKDGRLIWPIMGGDDTVPPAAPPTDPAPTDPAPAPVEPPKVEDGKGGKDAILADLAKERDKRQAAEAKAAELQTAQQAQLDAIAKALGLKGDETPDPAKLTEQLTTEQQKAREAQTQLAVYRNAAAAGGNPDALLDSASFLGSLSNVDPTDAEAVKAAVRAAVDANPRLAAEGPKVAPSFGGGPRPGNDKPEPTPGMARLRAAYADSAK